ncbi:probable E3 ubiquitin-protein ligase makorin-1 isoform X2 [Anoplophora glabripennis]|uniref:RING-type E3 ubiquitin transferase n=1 Tax=Anoplophora glabripennis TaxID=217634 RepID=V5H577_ANOGL|nr:probable E3 ubiquitin-protein ligase makorin-1 isoform X2 [Anoplophora glabripennis]
MADVARFQHLDRFCIHYYDSRECPKGETCNYQHKARFEVEKVRYILGEEFFLGRIRTNQRVCRFFKRGNCIHQQNCHYRHDNDNSTRNLPRLNPQNNTVLNNTNRNSNRSNISTNLPSTSSQSAEVNNKNSINKNQKEHGNNKENKPAKSDINNCQNNEEKKDQPQAEDEEEEGACASPPLNRINDSWVNAPEFVPKSIIAARPRSYAEALSPDAIAERNANRKLCPYVNKDGICRNLTDCTYLHGEMCDMCERLILHPYNEEQRKRHRQECIKQHEKNMELSFAIARSKEKSCGVCFEVIMEKAIGEQRFGILPNCNHCFCLSCIRKWRQARQFENKIIRACPECRVTSDFVCPSMYWVDTKEDKEKLIDDYKNALSRKDCKYFKKGQGKCPFGNKCFYLHAFPDGSKCDVGPPPRQRRPRNVDTDIDVLQVMLWDFLDERDFPWQSLADDLEDLVSFFTDSDESDWSDYELFFD